MTTNTSSILAELCRRGNLSGLTEEQLQAFKKSLSIVRQDLVSQRQSVSSFPVSLEELVALLEHVSEISDDESEVAELCDDLCQVLEAYIGQVPVDMIVSSYQPLLISGMTSMVSSIQLLSLRQIERIVKEDSHKYVPMFMNESSGFIDAVLVCLQSSDDGSARLLGPLHKLFIAISQVDNGRFICLDHIQSKFSHAFQEALSVAQTRIIDLIISSCSSRQSCQVYHDNGVLSSLNNWLLNDRDPLLQVTTLELLGKMAGNEFGFEYLQNQGIVDHIVEIMTRAFDPMETEDRGMLELVAAQCIAFLGRIGLGNPEKLFQLDDQFSLIRQVVRFLTSNDLQLAEAAVTALGQILSSSKGIAFVNSKFPRVWQILAGEFKTKSTSPLQSLQLAYLRAFAAFFAAADLQTCQIVVNMFDLIGRSHLLMTCSKAAQNSFSDWKNAGYACLQGMACQLEGCRIITGDSVLVDQFLVNRSTEHTHEGHVAKFNLNQQIINTCDANNLNVISHSERQQLQRIREYVSQGVYFKKSETFVALGEAE